MDFLAWVHTPAEKPSKSRPEPLSRGKRFAGLIKMPEIEHGHLVEYMFEAVSEFPLTWQELSAWLAVSGRRLSRWECRLIHRMAAVYSGGINKYRGVQCDAPRQKKAPN